MRVILIEDHELLAQSLQATLKAEDVEVVRLWSDDRDELLAQATANAPGLLLLDFDLGEHIDVARRLTHVGIHHRHAVGDEGAGAAPEVVEHHHVVAELDQRGTFAQLMTDPNVFLTPQLAEFYGVTPTHTEGLEPYALDDGTLMTRHEREEMLSELRQQRAVRDQELKAFNELTAREGEVLGELMQGKAADTIAEESVVSVATIRTQIRSILAKLGVNSQLAAVARAQQARWDPPESG